MGLLRLFSFPLNLRLRSAKLLVESHFCICLLLYRFGHIRVRIPTPRGTVTVRQVRTNEGALFGLRLWLKKPKRSCTIDDRHSGS